MNSGIGILRELADTLEEEAKQVAEMEAELIRLRAANAELAEALRSLRPIAEAIHTALATMPTDPELQCLYDEADGLVEAIGAALSHVEQKPETCVWKGDLIHGYQVQCGHKPIFGDGVSSGKCPGCGKRVEVKG